MKTFIPKIDSANRDWYVVDLKDAVLGRAAGEIANILRGKNKPIFTPHLDTGDHVIAINAAHLKVTGRKPTEKKYYRYTGYPGGLRISTYEKTMQTDSPRVFTHAVKGMLPKNRLGRKMIKKLHVYADADHPHQAQKPQPLTLNK
ncbi:MAG: 50S ribosomal protein L13 [candidate division Zixibacteria bacterium]|nr:50S ribosomal protein L13 [candidate division Zixibacteria bacterium]